MNVQGRMVDVKTADGTMPVHLAVPEGEGPFAGVIVAMEAFGLNGHIKSVAERIAREGYVVAAPDFYYRAQGERVVGYDQLPKAIELMMGLPTYDAITADVKAAIDLLEAQKETDRGRIGMTGFCMGGFLTFLSSCRLPIKAAAPFYGGGIGGLLDRADKIACPMLLFFGDQDPFIPNDEVAKIGKTLADLKKTAEVKVYAGAPHGFFCNERDSYRADAAKDAWTRLTTFLAAHLKS